MENSFPYASSMAISPNSSMQLSVTEERISLLFLIVGFNFQHASCVNFLCVLISLETSIVFHNVIVFLGAVR